MGEIHPHKVRYWLHSTEKVEAPEIFEQKTEQICKAYHEAVEAYSSGIHTVSTDEMTAIQALERKYPDKPVAANQVARIEFEYIRHGTLSLIAFMEIATGQILYPYLNRTRTEEDFLEAIKYTLELDLKAQWLFICDGLNIHKSESLVRYVATQCNIATDLGIKGREGILKNMNTRQEFLTDPTHRIRFLYTPKHCSWLNQIEIWFSILMRRLLKRKSFASVEELKSSVLRFIEQYNLTAKAFRWTYKQAPLVA